MAMDLPVSAPKDAPRTTLPFGYMQAAATVLHGLAWVGVLAGFFAVTQGDEVGWAIIVVSLLAAAVFGVWLVVIGIGQHIIRR